MKTNILFTVFATILICAFSTSVNAQSSESLSKSLGLYVFPSKDQTPEVQSKDETDCFNWAKEQTGYDPMNPTKVEAAPVDTSPDGSAVKGAARGAAAGAAIGAIGGDAGEGAAIGAIAGGLAGRRSKKAHNQQEQQQSQQTASSQENQLKTNFNNAFTACMEGKGYTVK